MGCFGRGLPPTISPYMGARPGPGLLHFLRTNTDVLGYLRGCLRPFPWTPLGDGGRCAGAVGGAAVRVFVLRLLSLRETVPCYLGSIAGVLFTHVIHMFTLPPLPMRSDSASENNGMTLSHEAFFALVLAS